MRITINYQSYMPDMAVRNLSKPFPYLMSHSYVLNKSTGKIGKRFISQKRVLILLGLRQA